MKIQQMRHDKKAYRIGEKDTDNNWFQITPAVESFCKTLNYGDEVEIKYETRSDRQRYLTFVKKIADGDGKPTPVITTADQTTLGTGYTPYKKSPEQSEQIKRLAIGNMTSRSLIALQAHLTLDNVLEIIDKIYEKYTSKV